MATRIFNKLVRDKIPTRLLEMGKVPSSTVLTDDEYRRELVKKLCEETEEYVQDRTLEELADVLEVIHALCQLHHVNFEHVERIRREKYAERGGFEKKIYLKSVDDSGDE